MSCVQNYYRKNYVHYTSQVILSDNEKTGLLLHLG